MIGTGIGLGLAGYRFNPAGVLPVLDINFRDFKTFSSTIGPTASFSRASSGTYFDSTGVLQTASTNVGRINHVYNGTSWVCKGGLIEEQRTNLLQYSESFNTTPYWQPASGASVTANQAVAPDGNTTADNVAGVNGFYQNSAGMGSSTATNTGSIFAKANGSSEIKLRINEWGSGTNFIEGTFNLSTGAATATNGGSGSGATASMVNVGNGWYRCIITGKPSTTAGTCGFYPYGMTTSVYCWGAQFEAGASFASSYIPSVSNASTTRSADVMQITGSNFSGFWNQSEGTFATECDAYGFNASGVNYMGVASTGGLSQYAFVGRFQGSLSSLNYQVYNGSPDCSITLTPAGSNPTKSAFGFKANDCAASANGGAVSTDTTVAMTTALTQLEIGNFLGNNFLNGHIARLRYWNTRLDNATLRALST
jgi:hypothetical protein